MLVEAGFSLTNPKDVMIGQPTLLVTRSHPFHKIDMYYEWRTWASLRDADGRLPLFIAAAISHKWSYVRQIFRANMPVVNEIDLLTGLPLFMLAAAGPTSDIESTYNLLREYPAAIMPTMNSRHQMSTADSARKRVNNIFQDDNAKKLKERLIEV